MKIPSFTKMHTVQIEEYEGDSAYGPEYDDPYDVDGYYEEKRKKVLNDDGDEVLSGAMFYTDDDIDPPTGSRLTHRGKELTIISISRFDNPMSNGYHHLEIALQ
ncbi:MAG: hypothetical protein ACLFN4_06655 [Candidatus Acetothermia bacterium]